MRLIRVVVALLATLPLFACGDDQSPQEPSNTSSPEQGSATQPPTDALPLAHTPMEPDREPTKTGTVVAPDLELLRDRTYSTGLIMLRLNTDNTFEMEEAFGHERLIGRYIFEHGILILSDPQGSVGNTRFPMHCRVERLDASTFRLAEDNGTCIRFQDLTFRLSTE